MSVYLADAQSLAQALGGDVVTMGMYDSDSARDVARVCRAMSVPVRVRGKNLEVPARSLETVRAYLRGEIDVRDYRENMPTSFYAWKGSIYERQ